MKFLGSISMLLPLLFVVVSSFLMQYFDVMLRLIFPQRENLKQASQSEPAVNKSPKDTPTKKKNAKDSANKKEEKKESASVTQLSTNKESAKDVKEQPKDAAKEQKEAKETVAPVQPSNKEPRKTKKKNDILAQIGE